MATLDLYIDIDVKDRVKSFSDSSRLAMPNFVQGNVISVRIWPLQPTGTAIGVPYAYIPNTGKTIQFAIGTKVGNTSTHYVEQYSWTLSSDPLNPFFSADVSLNTTDLDTFLGSQSQNTTFLEINLVDGTPKTIYSRQITVEASVIKNATTTTNPGLQYATMAAVLALFQDITTKSVTIQSPDGTHARRLGEQNDGTPTDEQL